MNSEYGRRSAADMRAAQRDMLSKAEAVQPTVAVMEPNWNAMIASQKMQVDALGDIMEKMETLTTKEELQNCTMKSSGWSRRSMTCFWRKFKAAAKFPFVANSESADDA